MLLLSVHFCAVVLRSSNVGRMPRWLGVVFTQGTTSIFYGVHVGSIGWVGSAFADIRELRSFDSNSFHFPLKPLSLSLRWV